MRQKREEQLNFFADMEENIRRRFLSPLPLSEPISPIDPAEQTIINETFYVIDPKPVAAPSTLRKLEEKESTLAKLSSFFSFNLNGRRLGTLPDEAKKSDDGSNGRRLRTISTMDGKVPMHGN